MRGFCLKLAAVVCGFALLTGLGPLASARDLSQAQQEAWSSLAVWSAAAIEPLAVANEASGDNPAGAVPPGFGQVEPSLPPPSNSPQAGVPDSPAGRSVETAPGAGLADPQLRKALLDKLYSELGKAADAQSASRIDKAIRKLWHHTGSPTIDLLLTHAQALAQSKDYDQALEVLDTTIDLAPDTVEAWYQRARVHYMRGEDQAALADIDHTLSLDPKHYEAINGLGHIQAAQGDPDQAAASFRRALQINPYLKSAQDGLKALSSPRQPPSAPALQGNGQPI